MSVCLQNCSLFLRKNHLQILFVYGLKVSAEITTFNFIWNFKSSLWNSLFFLTPKKQHNLIQLELENNIMNDKFFYIQ